MNDVLFYMTALLSDLGALEYIEAALLVGLAILFLSRLFKA